MEIIICIPLYFQIKKSKKLKDSSSMSITLIYKIRFVLCYRATFLEIKSQQIEEGIEYFNYPILRIKLKNWNFIVNKII